MGVFEVIGTIFLVFGCVFSLTGSVGAGVRSDSVTAAV